VKNTLSPEIIGNRLLSLSAIMFLKENVTKKNSKRKERQQRKERKPNISENKNCVYHPQEK
jgi:hypothetical protein